MLGWSIRASAWRSAPNRASTWRLSMPALMSLSATVRRTGCGLLGHVDRAHAPLADRLEQLVRADDRAGGHQWGLIHGRNLDADGRRFEETACLIVGPQQDLHLRPQLRIVGALAKDEVIALGRGVDLHSPVEDGFHPVGFAVHGSTPWCFVFC